MKKSLRSIFPPSAQAFHSETSQIIELEKENSEKIKLLEKKIEQQQQQLQQMQSILISSQEVLRSCHQSFDKLTCSATENLNKAELLDKTIELQQQQLQQIKQQSILSTRAAEEAVWAAIFNNTIVNSTWLKDKTFSPGRWAMGYPALYAIYRILNEIRPKRILELGLGQSTRMIGQYARAFNDVEHFVVEHDPAWIEFFKNDFVLSERSSIVQLDREMVQYKEAEQVRVFKDFKNQFDGQKFDFICIDAPLGGDMKQYARIDILGLLPGCLAKDFVIAVDDCERIGETHTIEEMEKIFKKTSILFKKGKYKGQKDFSTICSNKFEFLSTM